MKIQTLTQYLERLETEFSRDPLNFLYKEKEGLRFPNKKSSLVFVNEPYRKVRDFMINDSGFRITESREVQLIAFPQLKLAFADYVVIPPHNYGFRLYHRNEPSSIAVDYNEGQKFLYFPERARNSAVTWNVQCLTWAHGGDSMLVASNDLQSLYQKQIKSIYTDDEWEKISSQFASEDIKEALLSCRYPGGFGSWLEGQTFIALLHVLSQSDLNIYFDSQTYGFVDDTSIHGIVPLPEGLEVLVNNEE